MTEAIHLNWQFPATGRPELVQGFEDVRSSRWGELVAQEDFQRVVFTPRPSVTVCDRPVWEGDYVAVEYLVGGRSWKRADGESGRDPGPRAVGVFRRSSEDGGLRWVTRSRLLDEGPGGRLQR